MISRILSFCVTVTTYNQYNIPQTLTIEIVPIFLLVYRKRMRPLICNKFTLWEITDENQSLLSSLNNPLFQKKNNNNPLFKKKKHGKCIQCR